MTGYMSGQNGVKSHCSAAPKGLGAAHKYQYGGSASTVAMQISLFSAVRDC